MALENPFLQLFHKFVLDYKIASTSFIIRAQSNNISFYTSKNYLLRPKLYKTVNKINLIYILIILKQSNAAVNGQELLINVKVLIKKSVTSNISSLLSWKAKLLNRVF